MINLLAAESKREIRAARANVTLRRYLLFIALLAVLIFATFGFGYYLTTQDRAALQREMEAKSSDLSRYSQVRSTATQFSNDLTVAKTILANEVVFSDLLIDITRILPQGVVLAEFNIGTEMLGKEVAISARGVDTDTSPLQLKSALEQSDLFENVKISSITRDEVDDPAGLTPTERRYPAEFELTATLSATAGKRSQTGANR